MNTLDVSFHEWFYVQNMKPSQDLIEQDHSGVYWSPFRHSTIVNRCVYEATATFVYARSFNHSITHSCIIAYLKILHVPFIRHWNSC